MQGFWGRFIRVIVQPESFFEEIRYEKGWLRPLAHLAVLALLLALGSVIAWGCGIPGDTPINASLTAQMDVYPYWRDTLLPQYGFWAYPLAMGLMMLEVLIIAALYTPIIFLVFRFLGGAAEEGGLLRGLQSIAYGLTPCVFGGFLPYLALVVGLYATLLQLFRGPAILFKNRSVGSYLLVILVLAFAIVQYWQRLTL